MRLASLLFAIPTLAAALAAAPRASACGGCFHEPSPTESTQVTGHRMIFSISQGQTTLWDQFSYAGNPTSFAWVLPVKGNIDIGLSSDALFQNLEVYTPVGVNPPPLNCPFPPSCYVSSTTTYTTTGAGGGSGGGVTVVSQKVVGPYDTVVLHATDPTSLTDWLAMNGYAIAADFAPVIAQYVAESFDFLALKLIPGADVAAMQPVRVTTPGAGAMLPLRMVAAGVGVTTPITLWVFGEGRYHPSSFPWFTIPEDQLVWDFASFSSNYKSLAQAGYAATMGRGWLVESAAPFSQFGLENALQTLTQFSPEDSGYGDTTAEAMAALSDDLERLWGQIPASSLWNTRLHAELPRTALAEDLTLGAAALQDVVPGIKQATKSINTPSCPVYPPCPEGAGGTGSTTTNTTSGAGAQGTTGGSGGDGGAAAGSSSSGCNVGGDPAPLGALAAAALAVASRLRRRRR